MIYAKKLLTHGILALSLVTTAIPAVYLITATETETSAATTSERGEGSTWGWLGLVDLVGLVVLVGCNRAHKAADHPHDHDDTPPDYG